MQSQILQLVMRKLMTISKNLNGEGIGFNRLNKVGTVYLQDWISQIKVIALTLCAIYGIHLKNLCPKCSATVISFLLHLQMEVYVMGFAEDIRDSLPNS